MKSWEDLTELEQLACTYVADYEQELEQLACTYVADYEQEIERCVEQLKENQAQDAIRHAANIAELEATIVKLIGMGAKNRDDAIRWIADGEERRYGISLLQTRYPLWILCQSAAADTRLIGVRQTTPQTLNRSQTCPALTQKITCCRQSMMPVIRTHCASSAKQSSFRSSPIPKGFGSNSPTATKPQRSLIAASHNSITTFILASTTRRIRSWRTCG